MQKKPRFACRGFFVAKDNGIAVEIPRYARNDIKKQYQLLKQAQKSHSELCLQREAIEESQYSLVIVIFKAKERNLTKVKFLSYGCSCRFVVLILLFDLRCADFCDKLSAKKSRRKDGQLVFEAHHANSFAFLRIFVACFRNLLR